MSLNWKEIDLLLRELDLTGGKIQKVVQPNYRQLILDVYRPGRRQKILISLEQGSTRIHATAHSVRSEIKLQRFCQLLRSRIVGGRIEHCAQLGEERIILIRVLREEITELYVRLWGGAANIVATDDRQAILDAFFRRPRRSEVSGGVFDVGAILASPKRNRDFEPREFPGDGSLSSRVEAHYDSLIESSEIDSLQRVLREHGKRELAKLESIIEQLQSKISDYSDEPDYRHIGDLLSANLYRVRPGDRSIVVEDYSQPGSEVVIELEPAATPGDNVSRYFEKYKKQRKSLERLRGERCDAEERMLELADLSDRLSRSDTIDELRRLEKILKPKRKKKNVKGSTGLRFTSGDYEIAVGRSARENDELLRSYAKGNDYWFHTRDVPGGYVFVKTIPGKSLPLETLVDAGNIALFYSRAKENGQGDLYYTQVKHLKRPKEGKLGLVLPTQEKNLFVRLETERIDRLVRKRGRRDGSK